MNTELARKVLEQIKAHPVTHVQYEWRCETGMCFAGWTAAVTGAKWVVADEHETRNRDYTRVTDPATGETPRVWDYAAAVLDISPDSEIFVGDIVRYARSKWEVIEVGSPDGLVMIADSWDVKVVPAVQLKLTDRKVTP